MKKSSTIFFQIVIVLIGIGAAALLLWEPQLEGRNVDASLFQIYFNDPFLVYAYLASVPFFVLLYQAFMLLGYIGENQASSPSSVKALRTIKYCALSLVVFILAAEAYLFIVMRGKDDIAGGVAVGLMLIILSTLIATAANVFEKRINRTV